MVALTPVHRFIASPPPFSLLRGLALALAVLAGCARGNIADPRDAGDAAIAKDASDAAPDAPAADGGPRCATDDDCRRDPGGTLCDPTSGRCGACVVGRDTCALGAYCDPTSRACEPGCDDDTDCGGGVTRCDLASHRCTGCGVNRDCVPGTLCTDAVCVPGCTDAKPCGVGSACCAGLCVDLNGSGANCGTCGNACGDGSSCCLGRCAMPATDPLNCGRCGLTCATANATPACSVGRCGFSGCAAGFGDCDGTAGNGCEAPLTADPMNCGGCGRVCPAGVNAATRCAAGACVAECNEGFGDCDAAAANGCEVELARSVAHCGACGRACPAGPNAVATCAMAMCGVTCETGFSDCDGDPRNGCEVFVATSAAHCGGCGLRCAVAHANAACNAGRCAVASCEAGWADCDGIAANGCEVDLNSESSHCGACSHRCDVGTACSTGRCASVCSGGATFCVDRCARLESDAQHCGACGHRCDGGANATPACAGGACGLTCAAGYGDCNGAAGDGCETNLRETIAHCGACGARCARANAAVTCAGGGCVLGACNGSFGNCNGSEADGCEADLNRSTSHCGACGRACSLPFATATCTNGSCAVVGCAQGFADCDGAPVNGCETNLGSSNSNCGACGRSCGPGTACSAGSCASVCAAGTTFCGGSCVSLASDARNCGGCGNACPGGQTCAAATCTVPPPANDSCGGAVPISFAESSVALTGSNVGATASITPPCGYNAITDVFYRITVPGPSSELVYADTVGTAFDTVLYFARDCGAALASSTNAGDIVCNDDLGGAGCASSLQSQVVALLAPGTWYLMVAGFNGQVGSFNLRVQHLTVGSGGVAVLPVGATTQSGSTAGSGTASGACGGASAGESTWWWRTCPEFGGGAFSATTCGRASWDTLLYVRSGGGAGDACNDDACGLQSTINGSIPAGAGLHTFTVDGYSTNTGTFSVAVTRP
jgi:hypothetical protein